MLTPRFLPQLSAPGCPARATASAPWRVRDLGERDALCAATIRYQPAQEKRGDMAELHILFFLQARIVSGDAFSEDSGRHHFCVEIIRIVIPWELQSTERLGGLADVFVFFVLALRRGVKRTRDDLKCDG
jgi:hypothetical protein